MIGGGVTSGTPVHLEICHALHDWSRTLFDESAVSRENSKVVSFLCGPVAQLGARFHGMEEVVGSIPTRSTNKHLQSAI